MEIRNQIEKYLNNKRPDIDICKELNISEKSLAAYKAHITRGKKNKIKESREKIEKYTEGSNYIFIKKSKLNEEQMFVIAGILDTLERSQNNKSGLETKVKKLQTKPQAQSKDEIKGIVIELRDKGVPMKDIKYDPRLKNISQKTIAGFNAWYNMGKYKKKN